MNSQLRQDANTSRISKTEIKKIYYPPPNQQQFIAFSLVEKEGGLGMIFHQRFLLFDSMKKSLGYYSKTPDPLPHPQKSYPEPKESVYIKKIKNFQFKATKTEIGRVAVKWQDLNGQGGGKKTWALKFKTNSLMNEWVITVNEAIQQGHHKPQYRPTPIRQSVKKDTAKYMTPFILDTGGIESRRNSVAQSVVQSNGSGGKNSTNWLMQSISEKQKQMTQRHNQIHNISNKQMQETRPQQNYYAQRQAVTKRQQEKQKQQKQEKQEKYKKQSTLINWNQSQTLNSADSDKTIKKPFESKTLFYTANPIVEEREDQSKVSNKQAELHNSESVKKFRIDKMPPIITEEHGSVLQNEAQKKITSNIKIEDPQQHQRLNLKEEEKNNSIKDKQRELTQNIVNNLKMPKQPENPINTIINNNNGKPQPQPQPLSVVDRLKLSEHQYDWTNPKVYPAHLYSEFVRICQQVSVTLIDNLAAILVQAQNNPTSTLYTTPGSVILIKNRIEFSVQLSLPQAWASALTLKQHSSIVSYITRLPKVKFVPLPNCVVSYKWHQVKCKALVNEHIYTRVSQTQNRKGLDEVLSMPPQVCDYFFCEDAVVVDHTKLEIVLDEISNELCQQISQNLCRHDPIIGSLKDLEIYCSTRHNISLSAKTIVHLLERCYRMNSSSPPIPTLISIIYSIKISDHIKSQLFPKLNKISPAQLQSNINTTISDILWQKTKISNMKVSKQLEKQVQAVGINLKSQQWIDYSCVWASLGELLGMHVLLDKEPTLAGFKVNTFQIRIEALSEEMARVEEILSECEHEGLSQDKQYKGYLSMVEMLERYEHMMAEARTNSNLSPSKLINPTITRPNVGLYRQEYSNLYFRIFYYQSLYKPYFSTHSQQQTPRPDPYNTELEQIMASTPPSYYTYLISINCLKWMSKKGMPNSHQVNSMIAQRIQHCRKWAGSCNLFLLAYYELCSVYNQQIFNVHQAIEYARLSLSIVNQLYGEYSAEAAERWFLLGNVSYEDDDIYEQALEAYQKSLKILQRYDPNTSDLLQSFTSSRASLLPFQNGTGEAEVTIRLKMIKLYLALNNVPKCLEECSKCLCLSQQMPNPNAHSELQIFSSLIKCLETTKQSVKLGQILEATVQKFGFRIANIYPNCSSEELEYQEQLRESMIKMCLAPSIALRISDENRKVYLLRMVKSVRKRYQHRYNKKQYNTYLTKILYNRSYSEGNNGANVIEWFLGMCEQIPIFSYMSRGIVASKDHGTDFEEINYNLYQNSMGKKIHATQNKMVVPMMRAMEAMGGVIGFGYLISCFSQ